MHAGEILERGFQEFVDRRRFFVRLFLQVCHTDSPGVWMVNRRGPIYVTLTNFAPISIGNTETSSKVAIDVARAPEWRR